MSGKSQMIGDLTVSRLSQMLSTRNRKYPRSSGMDGNKSGESGAFLFSRRVPDFCVGRRSFQSFPTNENSHLYRRGRRRWISLIQESPKLLGSSPAITNNKASLENLGQTSGDYPIYRQIWDGRQKVKSPFVWDFPDI